MVVFSDLIYRRLLFVLFWHILQLLFVLYSLGRVFYFFFHVSSLRRGVSRHSKCLPLCHLQSALVFEQVAINNASELNFNEDEAPAIRGGRLH